MSRLLFPAGRGVFLALAAVAVALVLLRPACEQWLAHGGAMPGSTWAMVASGAAAHDASAAPCCSSVSAPDEAVPVLASAGGWATPLGIASLGFVLSVAGWLARTLNSRRALSRPPQSFYLRSTRILR